MKKKTNNVKSRVEYDEDKMLVPVPFTIQLVALNDIPADERANFIVWLSSMYGEKPITLGTKEYITYEHFIKWRDLPF